MSQPEALGVVSAARLVCGLFGRGVAITGRRAYDRPVGPGNAARITQVFPMRTTARLPGPMPAAQGVATAALA